ncbi:MAG: hypothetical protein ACF8NJ_10130 [Phycisphaerales bacterium JB038]
MPPSRNPKSVTKARDQRRTGSELLAELGHTSHETEFYSPVP